MEGPNIEQSNISTESKEKLKEDFENKFAQKETIEDFFGDKLEFVDIRPDKEKTSVPVLLAPGWAENPEILKEVLSSLYNKRRRSLSLTHSRYGRDPVSEDKTSAVELRKAEALLAIIQEKNISQVDAVVHSEGGINGVLAAMLSPEKFRNIILVDAAGLIGKDNFFKLAGRFILGIGQGLLEAISDKDKRGKIIQIQKEILTYISKNPVRAIKESNAIAKEDITETLKYLRGKGIGIVIIHAVDDMVFPIDKVQMNTDADMVDGFYSTKGKHIELVTNPKKYIDLVDHALDALESKKAKK